MLPFTAQAALAFFAAVHLVLVLMAAEAVVRWLLRWTGTGRPTAPAPRGRTRGPRAGRIRA